MCNNQHRLKGRYAYAAESKAEDLAVQKQCKSKLEQRRAARHAAEDAAFLKQRNADCLE